jgi:hypothetical protein
MALDPDELERRFTANPAIDDGTIHMIVVRRERGVHDRPVRAQLDRELGVIGDRWIAMPAPDPEAQVTLMERRVAELIGELDVPGDNFVVDLDLSLGASPTGTRLRIGSALVEITAKPHTGCATFRERVGDDALRWINAREHRERRMRGVHARIVESGEVAVGDRIARV